MEKKRISILGCGWYGLALGKSLIEDDGYAVKGSTTTTEKLENLSEVGIIPFFINIENEASEIDHTFFESDVLIISIPPKKNSPSLANYPHKIRLILEAAQSSILKHVILISSTAVFEDGNFIVDEERPPNPNSDSGKAILAAERILTEQNRFTTTIIRFAGLIGPNRNLAKHFAGKKDISNGLAPINLIHLTDCIGLTKAILMQEAFGHIYHGVAPSHPPRAFFYTKACEWSGFEKPLFLQELAAWKQIESANVPAILGYTYSVDDWNKYNSGVSAGGDTCL